MGHSDIEDAARPPTFTLRVDPHVLLSIEPGMTMAVTLVDMEAQTIELVPQCGPWRFGKG